MGTREDLDRLLGEYGLTMADVSGLIECREVMSGSVLCPGSSQTSTEYLVHASLLRPYGEYPCAGDSAALEFCREIVGSMVRSYGISRAEARARINRQWSEPDDSGLSPRVWIVGSDLVYHEDADYWAGFIYFGGQGRWWDPVDRPQPLPAPPPGC